MSIITLTSDWGLKDHYLAVIRGAILKKLPGTSIIDISHEIPPFNIEQGAYILKNAFTYFPDGTVHIIAINTEESPETPHTIVQYGSQYFVGADNGIFSLIFDRQPDQIVTVEAWQDKGNFTFSTRDRFVKIACNLAAGQAPAEMGTVTTRLNRKLLFQPAVSESMIRGHIIYVESHGNAVSNISEKLFLETIKGRPFVINSKTLDITGISKSYGDVSPGEPVAIFNSSGFLELAMCFGSAAQLLSLTWKAPVIIEF